MPITASIRGNHNSQLSIFNSQLKITLGYFFILSKSYNHPFLVSLRRVLSAHSLRLRVRCPRSRPRCPMRRAAACPLRSRISREHGESSSCPILRRALRSSGCPSRAFRRIYTSVASGRRARVLSRVRRRTGPILRPSLRR